MPVFNTIATHSVIFEKKIMMMSLMSTKNLYLLFPKQWLAIWVRNGKQEKSTNIGSMQSELGRDTITPYMRHLKVR